MPKTPELPPKHRSGKPTHDMARQGREPASGEVTPSGPLTDRSAARGKRERPALPTRHASSGDKVAANMSHAELAGPAGGSRAGGRRRRQIVRPAEDWA
jgi:hypothetical protein